LTQKKQFKKLKTWDQLPSDAELAETESLMTRYQAEDSGEQGDEWCAADGILSSDSHPTVDSQSFLDVELIWFEG
jgi:hypothetical protein